MAAEEESKALEVVPILLGKREEQQLVVLLREHSLVG